MIIRQHSVFNVKALAGAFSVIVKTDCYQWIVCSTTQNSNFDQEKNVCLQRMT